jgi:hypothetical protein
LLVGEVHGLVVLVLHQSVVVVADSEQSHG